MVNTKRASLLKTAIASGASCWREPFFLKNSRGNIRIRSLANGKRVRRPERAPDPGLKLQAASSKLKETSCLDDKNLNPQASSGKQYLGVLPTEI